MRGYAYGIEFVGMFRLRLARQCTSDSHAMHIDAILCIIIVYWYKLESGHVVSLIHLYLDGRGLTVIERLID